MAALPFKVKSVYEYTSEHDDDLHFPIGQVINVVELEGDDWYVGQYMDASGVKQEGMFPANFVEAYEPEIPTRPARSSRLKQESAPVALPQQPGLEDEKPEDYQEEEERNKSFEQAPTKSTTLPPPTKQPPATRSEPPAAPKLVSAGPAPVPTKAAPPPVAPKSNAFKDRIAAFNMVEAAPIKPVQPGRQAPPGGFIKKPFVAPPPSSNYVPPVTKQEPIHKPYVREEDPEIKQRQEQNRAAAEAVGMSGDGPSAAAEEDEDAPKPLSLKERMAMLQEQQRLQAERNADTSHRREKNLPSAKKNSMSSDRGGAPEPEGAELEGVRQRQSLDAPRERPWVPSASRQPMSPGPAVPEHEIISGGEEADQSAAGETTEEDDAETIGPADEDTHAPTLPRAPHAPLREAEVGDQETTAEDGKDEEEELDEEELRKQRLRERMARLAGPQGGAAPFNPFGAPPPAPPKKRSTHEKTEEETATLSSSPQQRIAVMPMPGLQRVQSPDYYATQGTSAEQDTHDGGDEPASAPPAPRRSLTGDRGAVAAIPGARPLPAPPSAERSAPPPLPSESTRPTPRPPPQGRPVPPPPQSANAAPMSPGPGSESDDEMSLHARGSSADIDNSGPPLPNRNASVPRDIPPRPPQGSENKRLSTTFHNEPSSTNSDRRASRIPPPVPGATSGLSSRPPPPPPPTAVYSNRQSTDLRSPATDRLERGESDYEGDYDTDIASSAKHKDALKSHTREKSLDDSTTAENTPEGTPVIAPRGPPPPAPQALSKQGRLSMDGSRAPPPVPPPTGTPNIGDDDYDPYSYVGPAKAAPRDAASVLPGQDPQDEVEDSSADEAPRQRPGEPAPPPPPHAAPQERAIPLTQAQPVAPSRSSMQLLRAPTGRASMEQTRSSFDGHGQMASDIEWSEHTAWWTTPQPLPPALQARNGQDILTESEESTSSKRGGRTTITKDIYILFMDYSQTHITAAYDAHDPSMVKLDQQHEPPAPRLRQDQLESYWQRFGVKIAEAARSAGSSKKDTVIGDGSPASLPLELIQVQSDALLPIGTRAYGALVYSNLANASTMQFDEIRPGDIITARNAKFEGHHGAMRQKYKQDFGSSHVAIVDEWDGTKRAVRAWEQGREKKGGVRSEKFRLGDLRSGEVRVWRVVGRDWVNWQVAS